MTYRVAITASAQASIFEQARYIAVDREAPLNAQRWLESVFDAADTLAALPHRCSLAPENEFRDFEIRRLLVGKYFLLFTIVEEEKTVWVIGFRHGGRLPRPDELPDAPPEQGPG